MHRALANGSADVLMKRGISRTRNILYNLIVGSPGGNCVMNKQSVHRETGILG